jgi:RNA recognition motif-containing protein
LLALCECRVVYVRNLPFNITPEEMYDIFGKFGALRQVRIGDSKETRGTAFVVYEVSCFTASMHSICAAQLR